MHPVLARHNGVVSGKGPPLVFAHGLGCDQRAWRRVAPRFEATHRVVLFDHVGAGGSDTSAYDHARHGSLEGYAEDLLEILDALELERVSFVGHSLSAMVGVIAAGRAPSRFDRLALIGGSPRYVDDPPNYVGGFSRDDVEGLLGFMDANFMGWATALSEKATPSGETAEELLASFHASDETCLRDLARVVFLGDYREALGRVAAHCLVVQCTRDDIVPRRVGQYLASTLPHATYRELDAPGHMPHMSHPDQVAALLAEYLSRPGESRASG